MTSAHLVQCRKEKEKGKNNTIKAIIQLNKLEQISINEHISIQNCVLLRQGELVDPYFWG